MLELAYSSLFIFWGICHLIVCSMGTRMVKTSKSDMTWTYLEITCTVCIHKKNKEWRDFYSKKTVKSLRVLVDFFIQLKPLELSGYR